MRLRTRLVLVAAVAVAAAVAFASVIVYFLVRGELRGQIDRNLQAQAGQIAHGPGYLYRHYAGKVYVLYQRGPLFSGYFQLVDKAGNVYIPETFLSSTPEIAVTAQARAVAAGTGKPYFFDTRLHGQDTRVLTQPSSDGYAVQVVGQLSGVDHELSRIKLWLLLVTFGGVAVASAAGFLVARATLRPVGDLSDAAERVRATRDLSQRIPVGGSDELSRLAATFNAMLESLDEAAKRQRQLVQDASHELRTPLTSLRTNIEVLAHGGDLPPDDRAQLLSDVVTQLGEMTSVIGELTELARGEAQQPATEDVRLDLVTEDAIRRAQRNHPSVTFVGNLAPTLVTGTAAGLERAIGNLLDNAGKWSPAGSQVDVSLADGELSVRDHGPGISDDDLPHVFERFYRATSARSMPGSGLGLAIVQQVAEAHEGSVSAERAPDGGTLMRLRIGGATPAA
ncbi:MAG: HAMP domain-containing sensor histidine kinase [Actinomycetes bacterium]